MVPDPSKTSLGLEYFVQQGDELWSMPDAELVELGGRAGLPRGGPSFAGGLAHRRCVIG